jgi:endonuclease G, mitochondrial
MNNIPIIESILRSVSLIKHLYHVRKKFFYTLFLILLLLGCKGTEVIPAKTPVADGYHLLMGYPSDATSETSNFNNYLIKRPQYTLSYSRDIGGTPNWVSWYVSKDWLGTADRQDDFRADQSLPTSWYKVTASSYIGSGFDRGHNTRLQAGPRLLLITLQPS